MCDEPKITLSASQYSRRLEDAREQGCEEIRRKNAETPRGPVQQLSFLVLEHLGVAVQSYKLSKFIREHWDEIRPLAHQIHKGD